MYALIYAIIQLLHTVINIYTWIIYISIILSILTALSMSGQLGSFKIDPHNPFVQFFYKLTDPVYRFIRQKIPFVVLSGIDLSPIVVLLALQFTDTLIMRLLVELQ